MAVALDSCFRTQAKNIVSVKMDENLGERPLELRIRHHVYRQFVRDMKPPTAEQTANAFHLPLAETERIFRWLHDNHFFFLEPDSTKIRMANPLSAVETNYRVHVGRNRYWANCAWDMLAIPAMLQQDAIIEASFEDDGATYLLDLRDGQLPDTVGFVHFPLPARQWYDDLILT